MALIGAEESSNQALLAELTASAAANLNAQASSASAAQPAATIASAFPATQIKLSSILKSHKN